MGSQALSPRRRSVILEHFNGLSITFALLFVLVNVAANSKQNDQKSKLFPVSNSSGSDLQVVGQSLFVVVKGRHEGQVFTMLGELLATTAALGFDSGTLAFVDVTEKTALLVKHHSWVMFDVLQLHATAGVVLRSSALQL